MAYHQRLVTWPHQEVAGVQHARAGGPDGLQAAARQALGNSGPGTDGRLALLVGAAARRKQPAQVAGAEAVLLRVLLQRSHFLLIQRPFRV